MFRPLPLEPSLRDKVWGARRLSPYFPDRDKGREPLGEAWLTSGRTRVLAGDHAGRTIASLMESDGAALMGATHRPRRATSPYFPILTKLLFIEDKLSVQVHPDDANLPPS